MLMIIEFSEALLRENSKKMFLWSFEPWSCWMVVIKGVQSWATLLLEVASRVRVRYDLKSEDMRSPVIERSVIGVSGGRPQSVARWDKGSIWS